MPMIRAMRLLNAVEAGTTTGAQLQTLLTADPGRLAELNVLLGMRGQSRRMVASSTAMAAVAASSTAMAAVAASSTAMAAVAASSTAMAAVAASSTAMAAVAASSTAMAAVNGNDQAVRIWMLGGTGQNYASFANVAAVAASSTAMAAVAASSTAMAAVAASTTAMNAVAASSTAKMAIFNSDTALTAVQGSSTALTALRAAAQYSVQGASFSSGATTIPGLNAAGSYILLGISSSNAGGSGEQITTINTRRSGSTRPNTNLGAVASDASAATSVSHATPLVAPFTAVGSSAGYTWFFGLLRCDV